MSPINSYNINNPITPYSPNMDEKAHVQRWLIETVRLPQYYENFIQNGFESLFIIKDINDRDILKEIGIILAGHQLKIITETAKLRENYKYQTETEGTGDDNKGEQEGTNINSTTK